MCIRDRYTTYKATELTFVDWIRLHPVVTVLVLLIFGWLLTAMAVTMVRLSARKKAQKAAQEKAEKMAELAEHAQAANKAKTAFLSHMSHDMRTPMNAIIGFTGIAMKNNPSDEVKNCLEKIDESSEHLLSLICLLYTSPGRDRPQGSGVRKNQGTGCNQKADEAVDLS